MQSRRQSTIREIDAKDFIVPDRKTSPGNHTKSRADFEDAIFEVIATNGRSRDQVNDNHPFTHKRSRAANTPFFTRLMATAVSLVCLSERSLKRLSPQGFMTLLSVLSILVFWCFGGFTALVAAPAKQLGTDAPFSITRLTIAAEDANGMRIAKINGEIHNRLGSTVVAPRLKILTDHGRKIIGIIDLPVKEIGPASRVGFSGRFNLAGGKTDDIEIVPEVR